jgi:hypothetical protein
MAKALESRLQDIRRFYEILEALESAVGGKRTLRNADGRMDWPRRGLYFFFEPGEARTTSGTGLRVVRVGTHALKAGAQTTLWRRLRQHCGTFGGSRLGGGDHRGSVFRHHVGTALIRRDRWPDDVAGQWATGSSAPSTVRQQEYPLEQVVSRHIRQMPFLWVDIDDEPGPNSLRGYIERNAIALLSNYNLRDAPIDPPSATWLGQWAASEQVRCSGLWNVNHVADTYDPNFLHILRDHIS